MQMQLRPQPWTHHHTHRLYHMSLGFCFAFAALAMIGTMTTVWNGASAGTITQSDNIAVTANVVGINPGPVTSGSGSHVPPTITPNPTINIIAEPAGQVPTCGATYVFDKTKPAFSGTASVPNGLIFITVRGRQDLNSTTQANSQGKWYWQSPIDLVPGGYEITVAVFDSFDLTKSGNAKAVFIIELPKTTPGTQPGTPGTSGSTPPTVPPTTPTEPQVPAGPTPSGKTLFGIFFNVVDDYKYTTVGKEVVTSTTLISNAEDPVSNQEVNYTIISPKGKVIVNTTDAVTFDKRSQFLKTFYTAPNTPDGDYTINVSSTYKGINSVASDTFRLLKPISAAATQSHGPTIIWILLLLLWLLFIILMIIAYRHARHYTRELGKLRGPVGNQ